MDKSGNLGSGVCIIGGVLFLGMVSNCNSLLKTLKYIELHAIFRESTSS